MNASPIKTALFRAFVLLTFPIGAVVLGISYIRGRREGARRRRLMARARELAVRYV